MGTKRHFREVGKDVLTYGFMSALTHMSGILLLPLLTRAFSVDEYSAVDVIATFVALLTTGMKLALPNALVRY
jgi:O-antigen/teichoic acid export membrane protein